MSKIIKILLAVMLLLTPVACSRGNNDRNKVPKNVPSEVEDKQEEKTEEKQEEKQPEPQPEPDPEPVKEETGGIRPEIREAIDAYESFIDEYIAFMKTYSESDNSIALLMDYMKFAAKLEEYETKMDKLEEELTHEEDIYFLEVVNRCNVKLLKSMQ